VKRVAAILAGGESRRFGADKAMAEILSRPMIAHVAHALNAEALAVAGHEKAANDLNATLLSDPPVAIRGPLIGVLAGLEWAKSLDAEWLVTAPCDVPLLPKDMAARLIAAAESKGAELAYAVTRDGPHALCAAWRPSLARQLKDAFAQGFHPAVRDICPNREEVMFEDAEAFLNVNSLEDMSRAAAYLEERG
jgi:molybdopterin-guanine dinucleotide biosynthesis protein A